MADLGIATLMGEFNEVADLGIATHGKDVCSDQVAEFRNSHIRLLSA